MMNKIFINALQFSLDFYNLRKFDAKLSLFKLKLDEEYFEFLSAVEDLEFNSNNIKTHNLFIAVLFEYGDYLFYRYLNEVLKISDPSVIEELDYNVNRCVSFLCNQRNITVDYFKNMAYDLHDVKHRIITKF